MYRFLPVLLTFKVQVVSLSIAWRQEKPDLKVTHMSVAKTWSIKKLLFTADYLGVIQIHQSPDEIFFCRHIILKQYFLQHAQIVLKFLVWIFKEKNKYKVTTGFFENTYSFGSVFRKPPQIFLIRLSISLIGQWIFSSVYCIHGRLPEEGYGFLQLVSDFIEAIRKVIFGHSS